MPVVLPFSDVPRTAITEYLLRQGLSRSVIDWKYFDSYLERQGERGHVLVHNDQPVGFLGLIPFSLADHSQHRTAAWSCDWFRDASAPGLLAIALIKESLRSYNVVYSLGGGEKTTVILPRLARHTFGRAAITLHKPLRLSIFSTLAARKTGMLFLQHLSPLLGLRLTGWRSKKASPDVTITSGLAPEVYLALLESDRGTSAQTNYGVDYLRWQLERCPDVVSFTALVRGAAGSYAAILFWRHSQSAEFWRLAVLGSKSITSRELQAGLDAVADYITDHGGSLLSVLISYSQTQLLDTFTRRGFLRSRRYLPLYVLSKDENCPCGELAELSYLDTDLHYRFSLVTGD